MTRTSISDLDYFLNSVRAALDDGDKFRMFKRLPGIETIEGVPPTQGAEYRDIVLHQTPDLLVYLDKFKENDKYGDPKTSEYQEGMMSPTTWRYIKVLSDLQVLFGDLADWDIVEIGAGYGGQCKIINDVYDIGSYTIYDLGPVSELIRKYLVETGTEALCEISTPDFRRMDRADARTYDLAISNWAWSECTKQMQDLYIEHILRRSKRGYVTFNQISHLCGVESYRKHELRDALGFPVEIMDEGLSVEIPEDMEQFVFYWHSQPFLDDAPDKRKKHSADERQSV